MPLCCAPFHFTTKQLGTDGGVSETTQKIDPPNPLDAKNFCAENPTDESCSKKSECEKNPNTVGCAELGDINGADDFLKKDIPISFTPVQIGGTATCPAPLNLNIRGHIMTVDYDPICQFAAGINPVFIAMSYLSAALIIIGGIRENA